MKIRNSHVFLGALSGLNLRRLEVRDGRVAHEEVLLLQRPQRIRDVRQGPDGLLYVLTDAQRAPAARTSTLTISTPRSCVTDLGGRVAMKSAFPVPCLRYW